MFSFDRLSPYDFELLVRDLLSAEHSQRFEALSPGPDSGIDLRTETDAGMVIVQCIHYRNTRLSELRRLLARERSKLDQRKPVTLFGEFSFAERLRPQGGDRLVTLI